MSLITWEPATELARFRRQFDALFDSFLAPPTRMKGEVWNPVCTSAEDDKEITLNVELPGVDEKHVAVELAGNLLTVKASRTTEKKDKDRSESFTGSFERSVTLPETVDLAKIQATHAKGLLTIRIPKLPQQKAKPIPIASA